VTQARARRIEELTSEELAEVERVESELDAFVEKRARQAKDAESTAALWPKAEREHREKKRSANGWGWVRHYEGLARAHRTLAEENASKANHVRGVLGQPIKEKEGEMSPSGPAVCIRYEAIHKRKRGV
jgi:hypothetical protein